MFMNAFEVSQFLLQQERAHCRIGRVRMKGGTTWIIVPRPKQPRPNVRSTMTMGARRISEGLIEAIDLAGINGIPASWIR